MAQAVGPVGPAFVGFTSGQTESYRLAFLILSGGALISVPLALPITSSVRGASGW